MYVGTPGYPITTFEVIIANMLYLLRCMTVGVKYAFQSYAELAEMNAVRLPMTKIAGAWPVASGHTWSLYTFAPRTLPCRRQWLRQWPAADRFIAAIPCALPPSLQTSSSCAVGWRRPPTSFLGSWSDPWCESPRPCAPIRSCTPTLWTETRCCGVSRGVAAMASDAAIVFDRSCGHACPCRQRQIPQSPRRHAARPHRGGADARAIIMMLMRCDVCLCVQA